VLIEIASNAKGSDVSTFKRKSEFYEKKTGKTHSKPILVTHYADQNAIELAKKLNVELHAKV